MSSFTVFVSLFCFSETISLCNLTTYLTSASQRLGLQVHATILDLIICFQFHLLLYNVGPEVPFSNQVQYRFLNRNKQTKIYILLVGCFPFT